MKFFTGANVIAFIFVLFSTSAFVFADNPYNNPYEGTEDSAGLVASASPDRASPASPVSIVQSMAPVASPTMGPASLPGEDDANVEEADGPTATPAPAPAPAPLLTPDPTPDPSPQLGSKPTPMPSVPPEFVRYRDKVVVLMYHHIALSEAGEEITITPERFRSQLQAIKDAHYQVISMEDYIRYLNHDEAVPPNAVVITFDDGYESFYTYGYPILKSLGFTATNFVVVSYIDSINPKLPFLNWKEIVQMHKDGFSFYSHTYDMHHKFKNDKGELVAPLTNPIYMPSKMRMETEQEYHDRVYNDLLKAKTMLAERLGNTMQLLCFPMGIYNQEAIDIAKEVGIQYFFTTQDGINTTSNKEIYRINAGTRYVSADRLLQKLDNFKDKPTATPTPSPAPVTLPSAKPALGSPVAVPTPTPAAKPSLSPAFSTTPAKASSSIHP